MAETSAAFFNLKPAGFCRPVLPQPAGQATGFDDGQVQDNTNIFSIE
jgi:hypothetical protein